MEQRPMSIGHIFHQYPSASCWNPAPQMIIQRRLVERGIVLQVDIFFEYCCWSLCPFSIFQFWAAQKKMSLAYRVVTPPIHNQLTMLAVSGSVQVSMHRYINISIGLCLKKIIGWFHTISNTKFFFSPFFHIFGFTGPRNDGNRHWNGLKTF